MGNSSGARFCNVNTIAFDSNNNIYLAGTFSGTAYFISVTKNSTDGRIFLLKISPSGALGWINQIKSDGVDNIVGLSVDSENNVMAMGNYNNNIYFGSIHLPGIGNGDIFWAKYSSDGTPLHAKALGGTFIESLQKTTRDSKGNFYGVGSYRENGTILGQDTLDRYIGGYNTFLLKLQPDGEIVWTSSFGGQTEYYPNAIGIDGLGSIYLGGLLTGTLTFGDHVVESFWGDDEQYEGYFDGFLAKYVPRFPSKYIFTGNGLWSAPENWHNGHVPGNKVYELDSVIIASNPGDSCFLDTVVNFEPGSFFHINENSHFIVEHDMDLLPGSIEDSTFTDPRDGNVYTIKRYGNQVWMTQDLRYGSNFPPCVDCNIYGRFYEFPDPSKAGSVAPPGWHVPSEQEWQVLVNFLGGNTVAGAALKDTLYWNAPNLGATNSSGFNARAGGLFDFISWQAESLGDTGFWWTTTVWETQTGTVTEGRYISMSTNSASVGSGAHEVSLGFKIRCVKD
jgi:uncharacterized protein (TIGR02145 family)